LVNARLARAFASTNESVAPAVGSVNRGEMLTAYPASEVRGDCGVDGTRRASAFQLMWKHLLLLAALFPTAPGVPNFHKVNDGLYRGGQKVSIVPLRGYPPCGWTDTSHIPKPRSADRPARPPHPRTLRRVAGRRGMRWRRNRYIFVRSASSANCWATRTFRGRFDRFTPGFSHLSM
jgi:hypothetical protein